MNEIEPIISVVVPIYNVEPYLSTCIESIVNQTYNNLEIILVDDGSPDNCPQICDQWAGKDKRIVVIHKKNGGLSDARNAGINIAKGQYISFIDSDDYIEPTLYEKMLQAIINTGAEIACCGRYVIDNDKQVLRTCHVMNGINKFDVESALREMLCANCIEEAAWDKLYKIELFDNIRYPVGEINEDIVTTPLLFDKCSKIVHVGEPLYYYRFNNTGISKSKYNSSKHIVIQHIKYVTKFITETHPVIRKETKIFQGRYALAQLLAILSDNTLKKMFCDDYMEYCIMLRKSLPVLLFSKCFSRKQKIQTLLIVTGMYSTVRSFLKRSNR